MCRRFTGPGVKPPSFRASLTKMDNPFRQKDVSLLTPPSESESSARRATTILFVAEQSPGGARAGDHVVAERSRGNGWCE